MPATNALTASFTIDAAAHALRFERDLGAPPATVFSAWTDPDQVALWWDATGEELAECKIDLREGGEFRFGTSHHPDKPFTGVYRTISPPDLLVFDANGAVGTVTLLEEQGGTRMMVEIVCSSAEHLRQFVAMGVADGTRQTLDNLATFLNRP